MSGGSLPSVRSLDALLEAVAVEPPPRDSEPFGRPEWRDGDDAGEDPDFREGSFSEEDVSRRERGGSGDERDERDDDDEHHDHGPNTPPTQRAVMTLLPLSSGGAIPGAAPSLSVAPTRWSSNPAGGIPTPRSRVSLFVGLGAGAALGVAFFAYLLAGPSAASPPTPASTADAAPVASHILATPPFDAKLAEGVLAAVDARVPNCRSAVGPSGRGSLHLTFAPDGTVTNVAVDPPYAGTSRGACLVGLFRTPRVPPFSGAPDPLLHTFSF